MRHVFFCFLAATLLLACTPAKEPTAEVPPEALSFGPMRYGDICRQGLLSMERGDVDAYVNNFAEDIIYRFNNGDSIVGRKAVIEYWKDRRNNVIDHIEFTNDIWVPLRVNDSNQDVKPGIWVLGWYRASSTYKTGKSMSQFIHTLYHFNADDKIDEVIQYLDRLPIMQATTK
jgi:ketosteroid isomerase-like protein